jgi:energy-coupling factor transport system ATP-binding protein
MLDPKGRKEINELVRSLNQKNHMTILSITHDIEEAAKSDHVILLEKGHIIDEGAPEKVLSDTKRIRDLGLDVPFAYQVSEELIKRGIPVEKTLDTEKLVKALCQLHSKM